MVKNELKEHRDMICEILDLLKEVKNKLLRKVSVNLSFNIEILLNKNSRKECLRKKKKDCIHRPMESREGEH